MRKSSITIFFNSDLIIFWPLVELKLLTTPEHPSSHTSNVCRVSVARSFSVWCFVDHCVFLFWSFLLLAILLCPSRYGFRLPLFYYLYYLFFITFITSLLLPLLPLCYFQAMLKPTKSKTYINSFHTTIKT